MKSKKIIVAGLCLSLLSACGSSSDSKKVATNPINSGDYQIVIPFESSDARQVHVEYNRGDYDIMAVGKGLMEYSKAYFDPDSYYVQEGQLLNRDTLAVGTVYGDKEGILGFKSSDNTYGLNPEKGSKIPISSTQTITSGSSTVPIIDVFEIDFYQSLSDNAEITGLSFAIVLNPNITDAAGKAVTIKDKQLKTLGEEAARNLIAYLETLPQVGTKMPIMISLFKANSSDSALPGTFLEYGYGKDGIDSFTAVSEDQAIFPSDSATTLDSVTSTQFDSFKQSLHLFLPNDIGVVGKGKFKDSKLNELSITITAQTKTYTECVALVQYTKDLLDTFKSKDIAITVNVKNNNETFAMLQRQSGSSDVNVIME